MFLTYSKLGLFLDNKMKRTPLCLPHKWLNWVFGPKKYAIFRNVCKNNFPIFFVYQFFKNENKQTSETYAKKNVFEGLHPP